MTSQEGVNGHAASPIPPKRDRGVFMPPSTAIFFQFSMKSLRISIFLYLWGVVINFNIAHFHIKATDFQKDVGDSGISGDQSTS